MEKELYNSIGFTHIWNLLKQYKTKLVGHNSLLDVLFMFSHFDDELPEDFRKFYSTFR